MLDIRHIVGAVLLFVKGLVKLIGECEDFSELEKGVHELCQDVCNQIFTWALEKIDTRLMNERDRSIWEVVGFRTKTAISTFGEFPLKRRLYRNKETGETKFFLDELLGWPERARVTPYLKELAIKLSTELSFGRAAEILSYLVPKLSTMTIWHITQEAGEILQREGEEKRAAVFEDGGAPGGKEVVGELQGGPYCQDSFFKNLRAQHTFGIGLLSAKWLGLLNDPYYHFCNNIPGGSHLLSHILVGLHVKFCRRLVVQ